MKRTNNNCQGSGIKKPFPVNAIHISFEIMRMAAISAFLLCMLLFIWPSGLSYASALEKVQPANPVTLPSTSLKTIIVGNYPPYTFVNDQGVPDGFSVDVARAVTHVMDLSLEIRVDTWEHATGALLDGTIDLLPMMAASPERDKSFDFSAPHTIAYDAIFMRTGAPRSRSLKELTDKTVIVMNKDAAHQYLLSSGMAAKMRLILVDSLPDALRTLAAGKGDPRLIRIAMVSLVENAFKFTGKAAHPRIEFGTTIRNGETACFIRDNGAGFEMAYAGKLFGAFQRLHAADEFPGTGIGLAAVQRIVHRHGGQVWAEGEKGQGATFYFTLP